MAKIISPTQSSFQQNRRAADNAIIVQEILSHFKCKSGKTSYMLFKLDLEKIFDRIEWSFVRQALQYFDFPPTLIKPIMSCLTTTLLSIIINGSHTPFFNPIRGLRQGDPLSPYLFIVCMKLFTRKIDMAFDYQLWTPISLSRHGPKLSHMFFVDDFIHTSTTSAKSFHTIIDILNEFNHLSGQKLTFKNTKYFSSKNCTPQDKIFILASIPI